MILGCCVPGTSVDAFYYAVEPVERGYPVFFRFTRERLYQLHLTPTGIRSLLKEVAQQT